MVVVPQKIRTDTSKHTYVREHGQQSEFVACPGRCGHVGIYLSATESGTIWCHHFEGLAVLIWPYNILAFQEGPPLADWQLCRSLGTGWNSRILYPIRSQHKSWHSLKIRSLPFHLHLLDPCSTDSNRSSWSIPHSPRPLRRWAVRTLPSMAVWEKIRSTT